jgi:hypothetical protein
MASRPKISGSNPDREIELRKRSTETAALVVH